ncbi:g10244 [Coccomyxa elongata]
MSGSIQKGNGGPDVAFEDQENINSFNKLFTRSSEIEAEIKVKKTLVDDLEDASNELMLADEEEVRYVVGECFYHAAPDEAEENIQKAADEAKESLTSLEAELESTKAQMAELKKVLYGKFGNSINLD